MIFPTISAREIQRKYKKILQKVNQTKQPIIVVSNNKPVGAIVGLDILEKLELEEAVKKAYKESKKGQTKMIDSYEKLEEDLKDLEEYVEAKD